MAAPTFVKGAVTLTFNYGNQQSDSDSFNFNDTVYRTLGGVSVVQSLGDPLHRIQFSTGQLTASEKSDFEDFINNTVVGRKEIFTYTDRNANSYSVRLIDDSVEFRINGPLYYEATVLLEVVP